MDAPVLSGLRLVATLPPAEHFSGCALDIARDNVRALQDLGAVVYEFDTAPFFRGDRLSVQAQVEDIKAFGADAVIGQPNAGYAVLINQEDSASSDGTVENLFFDTLELPTILIWDHAIPQASRYVLQQWPAGPPDSSGGVLNLMRTLLNHPRTFHFISDTGHVSELRRLGVSDVNWDAACVCPISSRFKTVNRSFEADSFQRDVAFFGNLYIAAAKDLRYEDQELMAVREFALDSCMADWNRSGYDAYMQSLNRLSEDVRSRLRLNPDESFHWRFLFDELSTVANGDLRFRKLASCGRPVTWVGGFADPQSRQIAQAAGWTLQDEYLEYGLPLAEAFGQTRVTIDIVNAPFINGFSATKILACFAAGGFMLTDRKQGILSALAPYGDAISFSSAGELAEKVDRYLTHDRERRELAEELRELVQREYTNRAFYTRAIPLALSSIASR